MVVHELPVITGKPKALKRKPDRYRDLDANVECHDVECKDSARDRVCLDPNCPEREWGGEIAHVHVHKHAQTVKSGSGWLERKTSGELVYHAPWLKRPNKFEMKNPKARVESVEKAWVRLEKVCGKSMAEMSTAERNPIGRPCGQGFMLRATNGHWALLERGEGVGVPVAGLSPAVKDGYEEVVIEEAEFYLAVERAKVVMNERSRTIYLGGDKDGITVWSGDDQGGFEERVKAQVEGEGFVVGLNHDYLEMVLGVWPLRMWVRDSESAVVFEPMEDKPTWRMVIMPMRFDVKGMEMPDGVRERLNGLKKGKTKVEVGA